MWNGGDQDQNDMVVQISITQWMSVGGTTIPVDKPTLLAPYIGISSTITVAALAAAVYVKRVKRRKEKQ
jgi:hypothetical protein